MAKKKVGVTVEENLHRQVKSEAPRRGLNIEQAYEQALSAWMGERVEPGVIPVSDENRAVVAFLADLFERKGTPEQEALKASLRLMLGMSKSAKGEKG
ncbi:MAG: hypothetical protein ABSG29_05270 [Steroidobacteraceae bacterium]|jgi:hypothetical protein